MEGKLKNLSVEENCLEPCATILSHPFLDKQKKKLNFPRRPHTFRKLIKLWTPARTLGRWNKGEKVGFSCLVYKEFCADREKLFFIYLLNKNFIHTTRLFNFNSIIIFIIINVNLNTIINHLIDSWRIRMLSIALILRLIEMEAIEMNILKNKIKHRLVVFEIFVKNDLQINHDLSKTNEPKELKMTKFWVLQLFNYSKDVCKFWKCLQILVQTPYFYISGQSTLFP